MTQWIRERDRGDDSGDKGLANKPDDPSSIPGFPMMERRLLPAVLCQMHTMAGMRTRTHTHALSSDSGGFGEPGFIASYSEVQGNMTQDMKLESKAG